MSLDESAIEAIKQSQTTVECEAVLSDALRKNRTSIIVPNGFNVVNIENMYLSKLRARGTMKTSDFASFFDYCKRYGSKESPVFVDIESGMLAKAIFNFGPESLNDGHCDNVAELTLKIDPLFKAMCKLLSPAAVSQKTLAMFIEDYKDSVSGFDSEMEEISDARIISAIRSVTIETAGKMTSSVNSFKESKSSLESVDATSAYLPSFITVKTATHIGLQPIVFMLRVVIRLDDGAAPAFGLVAIQYEENMLASADLLVNKLREGLGDWKIMIGTFKP